MRELDLEEVKTLSLEVLREIHRICQENGIIYSLTGGTLLGAIRHEGFIPWDDDIDITMPRPDYNKFIKYVTTQDTNFKFVSQEVCGETYPYLCGKACHLDTLIIEDGVKHDISLGVYVDIFPIDGVGNNKTLAKLHCIVTQILNGLRITSNWTTYQKSARSNNTFGIIRYVCYLVSKFLGTRLINYTLQSIISKHDFKKSKYAARLGASLKQSCVLSTEFYKSTMMINFEGEKFCAFKEYDKYLKTFFGDYMKLPSPDKRIRHHNYKAYHVYRD